MSCCVAEMSAEQALSPQEVLNVLMAMNTVYERVLFLNHLPDKIRATAFHILDAGAAGAVLQSPQVSAAAAATYIAKVTIPNSRSGDAVAAAMPGLLRLVDADVAGKALSGLTLAQVMKLMGPVPGVIRGPILSVFRSQPAPAPPVAPIAVAVAVEAEGGGSLGPAEAVQASPAGAASATIHAAAPIQLQPPSPVPAPLEPGNSGSSAGVLAKAPVSDLIHTPISDPSVQT